MIITLPDTLKDFIDGQVANGKHRTASAYIEELVRQAQRGLVGERVDTLIQQGVDSGESTPFTAEDWDGIRQEVRERHARRNGKTHEPDNPPPAACSTRYP
jgi:antitoxin ParD1/3/4